MKYHQQIDQPGIRATDFGLVLNGAPRRYPGPVEPASDLESIHSALLRLIEFVQIIARQRGETDDSAVMVRDLTRLQHYFDQRYQLK